MLIMQHAHRVTNSGDWQVCGKIMKIETGAAIVKCIPGIRAAESKLNLLAKKYKNIRIIIHTGVNGSQVRLSEVTAICV